MTPNKCDIAGIVVAGGRSERYGSRNKLLVRLNGRPLIEHVVSTVGNLTRTPPVIVVRTKDQQTEIDSAIDSDLERQYAFDSSAYGGPLGGIAGTLPEINESWTFVCAGDMPLVSVEALAWLRDQQVESTDAIVPVRDGITEPLHALYSCRSLRRVLPSLSAGAGPRAICEAVSCTEIPVTTAPDYLERSLQNVNTPNELEELSKKKYTSYSHQKYY